MNMADIPDETTERTNSALKFMTDAASLDENMNALLGGGALLATTFTARHFYFKQASKTIRPLYGQLACFKSTLVPPIVRFSVNPYAHLQPDRALILQRRNKEGKTTLLATAIPFHQRNILPIYGIT
eukprot:PhM_4_TR17378/c2_g1_i1/m.73019